MKTSALPLALLGATALAGCSGAFDPNEPLSPPAPSPGLAAAAAPRSYHHEVEVRDLPTTNVTTPEATARIHGCYKVSYASLGAALASRGVNLQAPGQNADPSSAASLYASGAAALGAPNYPGRVAESIFATTASMAKQFDITMAGSGDVVANFATSSACSGITLVTNNQFNKDGISCLIGKPAKDDHVTLANTLVSQASDPATGVKLAISALLSAAHTCE